MPRTKPFNKKTAITYALVHRSQHDPLIHDADAPSQLLTAITSPSRFNGKSKVQTRRDLEGELDLSKKIRENEGEAAEHGIYYDDSNYDYMQHLRELGKSREATWIEAATQSSQRSKTQTTLEETPRKKRGNYVEGARGMGLSGILQGEFEGRAASYQAQQEVPDEIAGFQPNMDPRLREVLEALEDEAYLDEEIDIFRELAGEEEVDLKEFESTQMEDEDESGCESDDTTKPTPELGSECSNATQNFSSSSEFPTAVTRKLVQADGDWLERFSKSKNGLKELSLDEHTTSNFEPLMLDESIPINPYSRKRSKGALTTSTSFSMTSSVVARTEALSVLDSRFDKLAQSYAEDDAFSEDFDDEISVKTMSTANTDLTRDTKTSAPSQAPQLINTDFNSMLDEFLSSSQNPRIRKGSKGGKRDIETGMRQLDEIRNGLGPARVSRQRYRPQKA